MPSTARTRRRPSLGEMFVGAALAAAVLTSVLVYVFYEAARSAVVSGATHVLDEASRRVEAFVQSELARAETGLLRVERQAVAGEIDATDPGAVEAALFAVLADEPRLSDATFTHDATHQQVAVYRADDAADAPLHTRRVLRTERGLVAAVRERAKGEGLKSGAFREEGVVKDKDDPTRHDTYTSPAAPDARGELLWSDLHWAEAGGASPRTRVVVTVQKGIVDRTGRLLGVVKVGLSTRHLDELTRIDLDADGETLRHTVILCDPKGRLVTRLAPTDPLREMSGDLRIDAPAIPPPLARALAKREAEPRFTESGRRWLTTFRPLFGSQDWLVGVVVPEERYTRELSASQRVLLPTALGSVLVWFALGMVAIRAVRRGLGRVESATMRMRAFDFSPAPKDAPFRDLSVVLDSLERAKTALRTLGRYAPVELVKELYGKNEEPHLGGELRDVTLMFTDIEGFTQLSERLPPDDLAVALGRYLEVMTREIRKTRGTIDKFIGDAVMAIWNAPSPVDEHAAAACRAALACRVALSELYASEAWAGLPPLVTRFGVHTGDVLVGHFGAAERMSYTALGDGVNLAARLESLCKQYGVLTLVSESVKDAVGDGFALRLIDRVAVKGKKQAVHVYELAGARTPEMDVYERALAAYFDGRFDEAAERLAEQTHDPPSAVLLSRCRALAARPPSPDWRGIWVATSK